MTVWIKEDVGKAIGINSSKLTSDSTRIPLESRLELDFEKRVPFRADGSFEV